MGIKFSRGGIISDQITISPCLRAFGALSGAQPKQFCPQKDVRKLEKWRGKDFVNLENAHFQGKQWKIS
jgi:hypothetical protein